MFPYVPTTGVVTSMPDSSTTLHITFTAPRSNGAEIFEYDVWKQRVRGGTSDVEASDSDPDPNVPEETDDSKFVSVLSAIPDEFTVSQAFVTSGHSGDLLKVLVEGLRAGTRHRFQIRAHNTRGFSGFTGITNTGKVVGECPCPPCVHVMSCLACRGAAV
jgi:hypothetical protein